MRAALEDAAPGAPRICRYWDRGGPPGRGYQANLLYLTDTGDDLEAVFSKTRFDELSPPYKTERYVLHLAPAERVDLVALTDSLLSRTYAEEQKPPIGGATKITVGVRCSGAEVEKTFYQKLPAELAPIGERCEALMGRCEALGEKTTIKDAQLRPR
jgi:hypothetical protein